MSELGLTQLNRAAAVPGLNREDAYRQRLLLPPPVEQRRIAEVLDRAEALRIKRRAAITKLDELRRSIFFAYFGDPATNPYGFPVEPIGSLVRDGDAINYGVVQPGEDCSGGVPMIRVGDLIDGRVRHSSLKRIAPSIESNYKRSRLSGDEILVSCVGSIGVIALADDSTRGFNIARAVARIPVANTCDRIFIAAQLESDAIQHYFVRELRTVSQPTLNIKQIAEARVIVPPLEVQREFASRVTVVDRIELALRTSRSEMDALFASLQHRAFRGEL
jgi:type I restriction enzyme S subunit